MHFCYQCGFLLSNRVIENYPREVCPNCGYIHYLQVKPTAGVLVEKDNRLLVVQRSYEPWKGCWNLPAGYMEVDESPCQTAEREALEETGYKIKCGDLIDVYFYDDDPRGNGLLILYEGIITGGKMKGNAEVERIDFFSCSELQHVPLAGGSHDLAIQTWIKKWGTFHHD